MAPGDNNTATDNYKVVMTQDADGKFTEAVFFAFGLQLFRANLDHCPGRTPHFDRLMAVMHRLSTDKAILEEEGPKMARGCHTKTIEDVMEEIAKRLNMPLDGLLPGEEVKYQMIMERDAIGDLSSGTFVVGDTQFFTIMNRNPTPYGSHNLLILSRLAEDKALLAKEGAGLAQATKQGTKMDHHKEKSGNMCIAKQLYDIAKRIGQPYDDSWEECRALLLFGMMQDTASLTQSLRHEVMEKDGD